MKGSLSNIRKNKKLTIKTRIKIRTINTQLLFTAVIALSLLSNVAFAQNTDAKTNSKRQGFTFEFTLGGGIISLEDSAELQTFDESQGTFVFPDLKFGYILNESLAVTISIPGNIYEFQGNDRHFGGLIPSVQYWVKDRWWIHGGFGLAIDSPALYDIEENVNDDWNFGHAVMLSTGYEFYKKKNFALNVQSKLVLGGVNLDGNANRDAVIFNVGIGFSWL